MLNLVVVSYNLTDSPVDVVNYGGTRCVVHELCLASLPVVASGPPACNVRLMLGGNGCFLLACRNSCEY